MEQISTALPTASWPHDRCQNCGDTKKQHRQGKCRTRRGETKWKPWTETEWFLAVKQGEATLRRNESEYKVVSAWSRSLKNAPR